MEALKNQLCIHILRRYAKTSFREYRSYGRLSPAQCRLLTLYVEAHVDQKISLAELAGVTQLGVFSFIRKFQAEFGTTARPALPVQAVPERGLRASSEKKKEEKRAANEDLRKVNLAWFDPNRNTLYLGKVPGWRRHAGQLNSHELNYS